MRYSLAIVGLFLVAALGDAAVVQRRYRNTEEVLVPVTVIQDGEEIKEIKIEDAVPPQVKSVTTDVIAEEIAKAVDEEQKLEAVEAVVEAQRRFDEGILEEEIKDVVDKENEDLLNALKENGGQLAEIKGEEKLQEEVLALKSLPAEVVVIQPESIPESENIVNELKKLPADDIVEKTETNVDSEQSIKEEEPVQQLKSVVNKETSEEVVVPVESTDDEDVPEGTLRQATQATPSQTTQQNFVQQFIQSSPLGQFFNQITGQNSQGQVANDEVASAPANPNPTIPGFLAPAITAAQSVVNTTTNAFQGLTNLASNIGTTFQNTLSSFTGQQPAQQAAAGDATTARPQGPFQQLVNTFMGNNNNQQAAPATAAAASQPAPQQQGPLQGLLNIFQGNNANNNRPQANTPSADTNAPQPGKEPEVVEQTQTAVEETVLNTADNISNEIRTSAEVDDSFEDSAQPDELIVVQDDASQTQEQEQ